MRRWTSAAPASRIMRTILREVVPRTIESSISTTRWPAMISAHRVELHLDAEVADRLLGLDERPADVVVAGHPELERQARLAAVAERRVEAAVGHRHDDVGGGRRLARQLGAQPAANLRYRVAEDHAVGTSEVDVFEQAARRSDLLAPGGTTRARRSSPRRPRPGSSSRSFRAPSRSKAHDSEAKQWKPFELGDRERPEAVRIARRDQATVGNQKERIGALRPPRAPPSATRRHRRADCAP